MFESYLPCSHNLTDNNICTLEMKDFFSRYANDIIATSAFGVSVDSFNNPKNEFYLVGKQLTNFKSWRFLWLKIPFLAPSVSKFIYELVDDTLRTRERKGIIRPDMIHLLMQARKGELEEATEDGVDTSNNGSTLGKSRKIAINSTDGGGRSVRLSEPWLTWVTSPAQARGMVPPFVFLSHDALRTTAIKLHGSPRRVALSFIYHMVPRVWGHRDSLISVYQASTTGLHDVAARPTRPSEDVKYHLLVPNPWVSMPIWLRLIGPAAAPNNLEENTESEFTAILLQVELDSAFLWAGA
uniref:Cytochrome P450 n=1 Tax=Timema douglasi TaxID=61478 RepID=A0A7R8VU80_TIMDO|nr:unnamed protein product [Timema douglasi]